MVKKKYNSIDLFKFVMAIFVIAIHTHPFIRENNRIYDLLVSSAVPFFFISSGFFLQKKMVSSNDKNLVIKNYLFKMIKLYLIWSLIYLPITIYGFVVSPSDYSLFYRLIFGLIRYVTIGEQFFSWPLWYLLASIFSAFLIFIFSKLNLNIKKIFLISIALFLIGLLYAYLIENINNFKGIIYFSLDICSKAFSKNGRILKSMFYICFGMLVGDNIKEIRWPIFIKMITILVLFLIGVFYYYFNIDLLVLPFSLILFILCLSISFKDNDIFFLLRKSGVIMYFTHMIFYFLFSLCVGFDNNEGLLGFFVCIVCTLLLSAIICIINRNNKYKALNIIFN